MAVHDSPDAGGSVTLPDIVPFELDYVTRMSWELGSRIVKDENTTALGNWQQRDGLWMLSVFEVTNETAVIRARTPAGRKRFYGAIRSELSVAFQALEATPSWQAIV